MGLAQSGESFTSGSSDQTEVRDVGSKRVPHVRDSLGFVGGKAHVAGNVTASR